ncbi:helix-turn-helix domain-containing protein [Paenibacillus sacheonensis]|uniref:Helix-turn-helix domain-containing protein n=1 Tax=Paenibacillus sacheonensis TaxID=742054 RepID=A0A7X4YLM2_9BACL|nr:AraC-like DNA-binding protein [Paenibacillus sacheonensis]NBC68632.1 helix-turn-helix domain-containing protein [Paenibacillus sacheonensis]
MHTYQAADCVRQDEKVALWKIANHEHEPEHTHSFVELVYILHGSGIHRINDQSYNVRRGDLLWMNVGDRHSFYAGQDMHYMNICIVPDLLNEHLSSLEPNQGFFSQRLFQEFRQALQRSFHHIRFQGRSLLELEALLESMYNEYVSKKIGYCAMLCGYTMLLLASAFRKMQDNFEQETGVDFQELLPKLLSYIEQHYASPITLRDLAKESYYSPQYISKTFKACCGYTFTEYVQGVRLREAKRLLLESGECVVTIGRSVGYADKSQFYRLFKQYYGITPQQLREQASRL